MDYSKKGLVEGVFVNLGGHKRWLNQRSSIKEKNYH
jgi:hypothetical protein